MCIPLSQKSVTFLTTTNDPSPKTATAPPSGIHPKINSSKFKLKIRLIALRARLSSPQSEAIRLVIRRPKIRVVLLPLNAHTRTQSERVRVSLSLSLLFYPVSRLTLVYLFTIPSFLGRKKNKEPSTRAGWGSDLRAKNCTPRAGP